MLRVSVKPLATATSSRDRLVSARSSFAFLTRNSSRTSKAVRPS
ncbi:hypothetical protein B3286c1_0371 [Brucella vulpis]|nr:hypothetical protein B3286c1_0371 [Brucella vulpis]